MAYRALPLSGVAGPRARDLIRRLEDHYFRDVHAMLRLPAPDLDISAGCNFAIAQVLASVVSGVSVTLYAQAGSKGQRFKGLLVDYYPWAEETMPERNDAEYAKMIYALFRNPLTHDLGLDLERKHFTQKVVVKRLTTKAGTVGHSERGVESLESAARPPRLSPLLHLEEGRVVLLVEAFYWGVRKMLLNLSADAARVSAAEKFLGKVGKP